MRTVTQKKENFQHIKARLGDSFKKKMGKQSDAWSLVYENNG